MSNVLEMALEALEWADNFHNEGEPVQVRIAEAIAALKEVIKQQGENSAIDAIYAAWHGAGVDIAGGDWKRFVGMLPPLYAPTLTIPAERALKEATKNQGEPVAYIHKWKPHAAIIGKSLHFTDTSPHGDDVEIIPLYTSAPTIPEGMMLVPKEPVAVVKHNGLGFPCVDLLGKNGAQYFGLADDTLLYTSAAPKGYKP